MKEYAPGAGEKERLRESIRAIWKEVLQVEEVGDTDNYFLLGGNSLNAIKIARRIQEVTDQQIPLSYIFSFPTIKMLADRLEGEESGHKKEDLNTAQKLKKEISIDLPSLAEYSPGQMKTCLITGASGYVGGYLLRELLEKTDLEIYCLVRADSGEAGLLKIYKNIEKFRIPKEKRKRIHPVLGDLGKPNLGMQEDLFLKLLETIDCIYHNGAQVHFLYSYEDLKKTNVEGTGEVLKFAALHKIKPVFYISTISIFSKFGRKSGLAEENEQIEDSGILPVGYTQSKWVAEGMVWRAKKKGLPVMIFRIGHVTGDSKTGVCHADDFIFRIIKSVMDTHAYPDMDGQIQPIAVDDAAKVIVAVSGDLNNLGQVFHVINPKPVRFRDMIRWAEKKNIILQPLQRKQWVREARKVAGGTAMLPFLDFFDDQFWEVSKELKFSVENMKRAMEKAGVDIQPISDRLIERYYQYLSGSGYLETKKVYMSGTI